MKLAPEEREAVRQPLQEVLCEAMRAEGATLGKIRMMNPRTRSLEIEAYQGFSDGFIDTYRAVGMDSQSPSAVAARSRRRVTFADLTHAGESDEFAAAARKEGARSMQATPILGRDGTLLGTLATYFDRPYAGTSASGIALDFYARRAAVVIEEAAAG